MVDLLNLVQVNVLQAAIGLGSFNANNVALFTSDQFIANSGNDVYRSYTSLTAVGADFGTGTETYQQANAVFSQQPNILAGGGILIIFPLVGGTEALGTAITRVASKIFYNAIISTNYPAKGSMKVLADQVQGLGKIMMLPTNDTTVIAADFTDIKNAGDKNTRCILNTVDALTARLTAAAYAGRGFSTDFTGSLTAITMNAKQLITILPDEGITQTLLGQCQAAGVDVYADIGGIPAVLSSGANGFFDQVYNLSWFVNQLQINGANALVQLGTKIPQTESGVSVLKSAYRQVCEQGLANGYIAPGEWTAADTFGVQGDFLNNIRQRGYYIYYTPVNQQVASDRDARKAPLFQIAIKEAGAVHSSIVNVFVNP